MSSTYDTEPRTSTGSKASRNSLERFKRLFPEAPVKEVAHYLRMLAYWYDELSRQSPGPLTSNVEAVLEDRKLFDRRRFLGQHVQSMEEMERYLSGESYKRVDIVVSCLISSYANMVAENLFSSDERQQCDRSLRLFKDQHPEVLTTELLVLIQHEQHLMQSSYTKLDMLLFLWRYELVGLRRAALQGLADLIYVGAVPEAITGALNALEASVRTAKAHFQRCPLFYQLITAADLIQFSL